MGQDTGDRHAPAGPTPEPFEVFYLREYPKVVGLLHGLLGSRLVAEELAQETFLVAYRDWDRISRLDNPRAWVRKVAINQRGSFLRAYLRQQTRERHAVVRYEDDRIKLADDHAEVWQAIRTLPPLQAQVIALHYYEDYGRRRPGTGSGDHQGPAAPRPPQAGPAAGHGRQRWEVDVNLDDRLRAASRALKDGSVAQVDAASRLREIVRHAGRAVTHGHAPLLPDEPWETPELLEASLVPPAPPRPGPQRLALVVNLMLVLGLGVVLGVAASYVLDADRTAPASAASTTPASMASTIVVHPHPTRVQAPEACLEAAALADEVISRLNRNERDNRLAEALRDYTIASQACRRAASP